MKITDLLLVVLLLTLMSIPSCSKNDIATLEYTPDRGHNKELQAKLALRHSMALDSDFINITDDSLINIAVKWYNRHGNPDEKLKAYYYQGRVYQNAGRLEKAMESFFKAEIYAEKSSDTILRGMLFNAKAAVYESLFRFEEAIDNASEAAAIYLSARDTARHVNSLLFICSEYLSADQPENAAKTLYSLQNLLPSMSNTQTNDYYTMLLHISVAKGSGIQEAITEYLGNIRDQTKINWIALANAYLHIRAYDLGLEAISHFRENVPEYDSNTAYLLIDSELNEMTGQYEKALNSYKKYVAISDNTDMEIFTSDAMFTEDKMLATYKIKYRNQWIAILILGIVAFASAGLLIYTKSKDMIRRRQDEKEKLEKEKLEIEKEMETYRFLYEQSVKEKTNLQRLRQEPKLDKEIKTYIEERLEVLNKFIAASVSKNLRASATMSLNKYLNDREKFIYTTKLTFAILHPKFISYLKESGLTEIEIGYCCLYCIGMNGTEIAAYLEKKSFYNASSIIRKKLQLGKHDMNLDNFLREKMHSMD